MKTTYATKFTATFIYNHCFHEEHVIGDWDYLKFHATTRSIMHNFNHVEVVDEFTGEILMTLES